MAAGFRDGGFRVTWVGPSEGGEFGEPGIETRVFKPQFSRLGRPRSWFRAFRAAKSVPDVDVFLGVAPDSILVALAMARLRGVRAVFDLHEAYHEDMIRAWVIPALLPAARHALYGVMRHSVGACDLVVVSSETLLKPYADQIREAVIVRNCAPSWVVPRTGKTGRTEFTILHGKASLGLSLSQRGTSTMLDALALMKARGLAARLIVFDNFHEDTGTAGAALRAQFLAAVAERGLVQHVDLRKMIPMSQMGSVLAEADVGVIAYNREFGVRSLPGRLFEYMAGGLAVVGPDYSADITGIVECEKCGLVADCEKPEALANALYWLAENPDETKAMGLRGRKAFEARYSWESEMQPLLSRVRRWLSDRHRSPHEERIIADGGNS